MCSVNPISRVRERKQRGRSLKEVTKRETERKASEKEKACEEKS